MSGDAKIRVVVVDDSAFMRHALRRMLERDPRIEVVAAAKDGEQGVELVQSLRPDVVTMDVEMRGIGGLEALRRIVALGEQSPPVIMVSSLTTHGARTTLDALDLGAFDFIAKPAAGESVVEIASLGEDLIAKIHAASAARRRADRIAQRSPARGPRRPRLPAECVGIGASTGGPVALSRILPRLPAGFPSPIVIAQHMPAGFTAALAERLNEGSAIEVLEASDGTPLHAGCALIAPAGRQARVRREREHVALALDAPAGGGLTPSVDVLLGSVGEQYGERALGVVLTGMGRDGVQGLRILKAHGGYAVAQDEASCIVFGMPRAAVEAGVVDEVVSLDDIPQLICALTGFEVPLQSRKGSGAPEPGT
jgi:two-component system chemotaxis response regulator CheB